LSDGSGTAKILIVSQDPSENAWDKRILFSDRNKTALQLAEEVLGVDWKDFNPRRICWTHVANCDTGKCGKNDRQPNFKCANKYLTRLIDALKPEFTLIMGSPALQFLMCDRKLRITDCIGKKVKILGKYCGIPILHTSCQNRTLQNNPELQERQKKAIAEIREIVRIILGREKSND
jgi:uracil-DNA glycosylase